MIECKDLRRQVTELIAHLTWLRNRNTKSEAKPKDCKFDGEASNFENPFHGNIPSHQHEGRGDPFE